MICILDLFRNCCSYWFNGFRLRSCRFFNLAKQRLKISINLSVLSISLKLLYNPFITKLWVINCLKTLWFSSFWRIFDNSCIHWSRAAWNEGRVCLVSDAQLFGIERNYVISFVVCVRCIEIRWIRLDGVFILLVKLLNNGGEERFLD